MEGLKDGAEGGAGGEDIVDDQPVARGTGKGVSGVDAVESLEGFFPPGF